MITTTALDARWAAVRAGFSRGWIETRQAAIMNYLLPPVVYAGMVLWMRGKTVPGTDFALAAMVLPSVLGISIAIGAFTGPATGIAIDAEDGTLLRAKATPNGMLGYIVGKIVRCALTTLILLLGLVIPGILVASDLVFDARRWVLLALTCVAGMVSTVPMALAIGSLMKSTMQASLMFFVSMLVAVLSGLFYPLATMPTWLQWVAQVFPFYWVGLGARAAMLPAEMAAREIGGSWRTLEMFAVLGAWAVIGMVLAPILLRRMARRQSGSTLAAARQRILSKGY